MNATDKLKFLKLELETHIGSLLLKFYDQTNAKIEKLDIIITEMPDGNVTGFYVQSKLKESAKG